MKIKKLLGIFSVLALLAVLALLPHHARAASINYTANANWNQPSCTANINGTTQDEKNSYGVAKGDDFNLTLVNQSSIPLVVAITLGGTPVYSGPDIAPGATYNHTYTNLQSNLVIEAAADGDTNACSFKNMTDGQVTVQPGSASLSCATVLGNKGYGWDLTGSYNDVVVQASLFEGSTNVASYTDATDSLVENFVAGSSATTFYFYNGFTSSDRLLAQATCQPPASSTSVSGNSSSSTSTAPKAASPTPTAVSPAASPQSTTTALATTANNPVQLKSVDIAGQSLNSDVPLVLMQTQPLTLTGHTIPDGTVTLTIHSTPKTVTVKADSSGNWTYTVMGLAPGNHFVEASVMAPGAKQASITTKLISFRIDPASAAVRTSSSRSAWLIVVLVLMVVAVAGAAFYFFRKLKHQGGPKNNNPVHSSPPSDSSA